MSEQQSPQPPGDEPTDPPLDSVYRPPAPPRRNPYIVPLTVAGTAGVVALVMALGPSLVSSGSAAPTVTVTRTVGPNESTENGGTATGSGSRAEDVDVARRTDVDPLALGAADAPVVMVEYSDFSCPYCASFAAKTEPELVKKYVTSGVLRIEWRDFPYLTDQSGVAAIVARAAARQGKFWPVHDALFTQMHSAGFGKLDKDVINGIVTAAGLDQDRFMTDFTATKTADAVSSDLDEGQRIGVNGTPTFVINGRLVVGAQPLSTFEQVIEQAAAAAG